MIITSSSNDLVKHIIKLQTKKAYRTQTGTFAVEGKKPVREGAHLAKRIFAAQSVSAEQLGVDEEKIQRVSDEVMQKMCDAKTPQGVVAEMKMTDCTLFDILCQKNGLVLFCDCVSDPGNLGTIIRTADAAGFDGVILSGCADLYNPKTVRSTMSSIFNVKIHISQNAQDTILSLKNAGCTIIGSSLENGSKCVFETDFGSKTAIIVGNEAHGIENCVLTMCDKCVKIPMSGKAESLNAGVAAAVLMYEAVRRRLKNI